MERDGEGNGYHAPGWAWAGVLALFGLGVWFNGAELGPLNPLGLWPAICLATLIARMPEDGDPWAPRSDPWWRARSAHQWALAWRRAGYALALMALLFFGSAILGQLGVSWTADY